MRRQHGLSLIELIIFIVIVSVGLVGILSVLNVTVRHSADPMVRKQALAIAEAMMEEVLAKDFANPDGGFSGAATNANRGSFDDIWDYNGFTMSGGIYSIGDTSTPVSGLDGYGVGVEVDFTALGGITLASQQAARIAVTVTGSGETLTLNGYRTNYQ